MSVVESTTSNPHLNVFEPYRELSRGHEDQLTRAAMIVLRLVPLARETLLRAIGEPSQSQLPDCIVDMQATNLVDPSEENSRAGRCERGRLVSVFLTPDIEPFELAEEVTDTDNGSASTGCCASTRTWSWCWRARFVGAGHGATAIAWPS